MTTRVNIDAAAVRRLISDPNGPIGQDLFRRAKRVESKAKRLAPVDTGRLRSSIHTTMSSRGLSPVASVGTNVKYAIFIHEGTGVFGPKGRPITPRRGQFLVFTPRGASRPVFARSVRGVRPRPFLKDALEAAR